MDTEAATPKRPSRSTIPNLLFISLVIASPLAVLSAPPEGYYASAEGKTGGELRAVLHEIIDDHTRYPYTASSTDCWNILNDADEDPNNSSSILDLYKNASYAKITGGIGAYNREHTWPKSYGFPDDFSGNYPYTDCHHLMACDSSYNSSRSNMPYDTGSSNDTEKATDFNNGQGGGSGIYPGNSNWRSGAYESGRWETWIGRRGDVARALFYMDVRYEGGTHGGTEHSEPDLTLTDDRTLMESCNTGSNEAVGYMGMLSVLLKWHEEDPVDNNESNRNDVVYSYQGNRNPFVDRPEWVELVFVPRLSIEQLSANSVRIRWDSGMVDLGLESTGMLLSISWQSVTNEPLSDSEGWYLDLAADSTNRFFRLSR
ncbi:MAG: endonuclease [Verrucomicrobia bacterium]|nr:endonuclease [Verrucomicrobiota bacterium]